MYASAELDKDGLSRQPTMGFMNDEGYDDAVAFEEDLRAGGNFRPPPTHVRMAGVAVREVFEGHVRPGKVLLWRYDHTDGWDYEVYLLGVEDAVLRESLGVPQDRVVACLGGDIPVLRM